MAKLHRAGVMWGGVRPENFIVKSGDRYPVLLATGFSHAALLAKGSGISLGRGMCVKGNGLARWGGLARTEVFRCF